MNIAMCESDNDEHAPFPHRILITPGGRQYVICAHCSCWIDRAARQCRCRVRCHDYARLGRDLTVTKSKSRAAGGNAGGLVS